MNDTSNGAHRMRYCASEWVFCDGECSVCDRTRFLTFNITVPSDGAKEKYIIDKEDGLP